MSKEYFHNPLDIPKFTLDDLAFGLGLPVKNVRNWLDRGYLEPSNKEKAPSRGVVFSYQDLFLFSLSYELSKYNTPIADSVAIAREVYEALKGENCLDQFRISIGSLVLVLEKGASNNFAIHDWLETGVNNSVLNFLENGSFLAISISKVFGRSLESAEISVKSEQKAASMIIETIKLAEYEISVNGASIENAAKEVSKRVAFNFGLDAEEYYPVAKLYIESKFKE